MRDFSIAGKMTVFKTLAISKIVPLALGKTIPNSIIQELKKFQIEFIWKDCIPEKKHGGLENVGILHKFVNLQWP